MALIVEIVRGSTVFAMVSGAAIGAIDTGSGLTADDPGINNGKGIVGDVVKSQSGDRRSLLGDRFRRFDLEVGQRHRGVAMIVEGAVNEQGGGDARSIGACVANGGAGVVEVAPAIVGAEAADDGDGTGDGQGAFKGVIVVGGLEENMGDIPDQGGLDCDVQCSQGLGGTFAEIAVATIESDENCVTFGDFRDIVGGVALTARRKIAIGVDPARVTDGDAVTAFTRGGSVGEVDVELAAYPAVAAVVDGGDIGFAAVFGGTTGKSIGAEIFAFAVVGAGIVLILTGLTTT